MDEKFLGLVCEKVGCCHCQGIENYLLSCRIVIHRRASWEKTFLLMISLFLRACESLGMNIMFVVLLLYGGEWCMLLNKWRRCNYKWGF